jgi:hypothetical protein
MVITVFHLLFFGFMLIIVVSHVERHRDESRAAAWAGARGVLDGTAIDRLLQLHRASRASSTKKTSFYPKR